MADDRNEDRNERTDPMKKVINYVNLLYPANEIHFTTVPEEAWNQVQAMTAELLKKQEDYIAAKNKADHEIAKGEHNVKIPENVGVPSNLVAHWRSIRKGVVPFGLKVLPASDNA